MTEHRNQNADRIRPAGRDDFVETVSKDQVLCERKKRFDDALDCGLEDSFPGSDPVAVTQPAHSARDRNRP